MYSIEFSPTAEKQLDKLEKPIRKRIVTVLERIRVRPFSFVKKSIGTDYYRARAGDHRAILDIREDIQLIYVVEVGHRRSVYR